MKQHWNTWHRTTLLLSVASMIVIGLSLYFQWKYIFLISVIGLVLCIVYAAFKIFESRPLTYKEKRKRRQSSSVPYEDQNEGSIWADVDLLVDLDNNFDIDFFDD